ncbi:MAG: Fur family transcriptional regulator [Pseudomonadota bacterium]
MQVARLTDKAREAGIKMTTQRVLICDALDGSRDHPCVDNLLARAREGDPSLSLSSIYRTMRALEAQGLIVSHDFGDNKSRYEVVGKDHHDHLIDMETGTVVEFHDPELEKLKRRIAKRLGYKLESHSLELYGRAR